MKLVGNVLIIDEYGSVIHKKYKRVAIVNAKKKLKEEVPIKRIRTLVVLTRTSFSTEVIKELVSSGIEILLCGYLGRPYAKISGARIGGTSQNRKLQYKSLDSEISTKIVKSLLKAKITNQLSNIKYYAKSKRIYGTRDVEDTISKLDEILKVLDSVKEEPIEKNRMKLMNLEAQAAKEYFAFLSLLYGNRLNFYSRDYRSDDILNVLLNVGYNIISLWYWIFVEHFSLDPYEGYLHVERPGRLSLVYDLMEPARPIVDRLTLSYIFSHGLDNERFFLKRYQVIAEFKKYMISQVVEYKLPLGSRKFPLRYHIFHEVESLVRVLHHKGDLYTPRLYW